MAILTELNGMPVDRANVGGYGAALESLATQLGCGEQEPLWAQLGDDVKDEPTKEGWCNVSNGEGEDYLYYNKKRFASVCMSSRGSWFAWARLADGRYLFSRGANVEEVFDTWVSKVPSEYVAEMLVEMWKL